MLEHIRFSTAPHPCLYLPAETAQLSYRLIREISGHEFEQMLLRGWRRFGNQFFRPNCPQCAGCRSLRVDAHQFSPSKSQRRILKRNADLRLEIRPPGVTLDHLRLWHDYHAAMNLKKGWEKNCKTPEEYLEQFVGTGFSFASEFAYYLDDRLVGVGLVDLTPAASSSIYFYYDPALSSRGLGVFSMLKELEYARQNGKSHHYLGYWMPDCPSLRYKSDYRPFELLLGFPLDEEAAEWRPEPEWQPILNREEHGLVLWP